MQTMKPSTPFVNELLALSLAGLVSVAAHAAEASPKQAVKPAPGLHTLAYGLLVHAGIERKPPDPNTQQVVSPVSLVSALGLVHASTQGASADELSDLIAPPSARGVAFQQEVPVGLQRILADAANVLTTVNRLWIEDTLAKAVSPAYLKTANDRYAADAALVSFQDNDGRVATQAINQWAAQHTNERIQNLLPAGAVNRHTQVVLTNALRFKDAWAVPFDPSATRPMAFQGVEQPVQTMRQAIELGVKVQAGVTIYELDFHSPAFSFRLALNGAGQTDVAAQALLGASIESGAFARKACMLTLPKFTIAPQSKPLKSWLQSQKVETVFSSKADFKPLLGEHAPLTQLSDVYVSAGIEVAEAGVEAVAATAAVVSARMVSVEPRDTCAVDRPFAFAIVHKPTGHPVFAGWVNRP
jgi:serpin B